jgi:hypothetical protein
MSRIEYESLIFPDIFVQRTDGRSKRSIELDDVVGLVQRTDGRSGRGTNEHSRAVATIDRHRSFGALVDGVA